MAIVVAEEDEDDLLAGLPMANSAPRPMETIAESSFPTAASTSASSQSEAPVIAFEAAAPASSDTRKSTGTYLQPSSSVNSLNRSGVGLDLSRSRGKQASTSTSSLNLSRSGRRDVHHHPHPVGLDLSGSNSSRSAASSGLMRRIGSSGRRLSASGLDASVGSSRHKVKKIIRTENIDKRYHIDYTKEIGRGTNTIVRKAIDRTTGQRCAVKTVKKFDTDQARHMRHEIHLLHDLEHPAIIQLLDCYEDDKYLHMVVELCKGGELYDYVMKRVEKIRRANYGTTKEYQNPVDEKLAAIIVHKVCDAVAYLHEHDIVHRDLKLENILFVSKPVSKNKKKGKELSSLTNVRLIDFGLSKRYNTHHRFSSLQKLTSFVGTNYYVAPEVLSAEGYTHSCDLWGVGVLAYALLSAKPPFNGRSDKEIYYKIEHCDDESGGLQFPSPDWDAISDEAKDFIRKLLVKDVNKRPSALALLEHPWLRNVMDNVEEESDPPKDKKKNSGGLLKKAFGFTRSNK